MNGSCAVLGVNALKDVAQAFLPGDLPARGIHDVGDLRPADTKAQPVGHGLLRHMDLAGERALAAGDFHGSRRSWITGVHSRNVQKDQSFVKDGL